MNNNPFEYWYDVPDPLYETFMRGVESFVTCEDRDVRICELFTDAMLEELGQEMQHQGIVGTDTWVQCRRHWIENYHQKWAVSEFLKDKRIGEKRLTSMPDRHSPPCACDFKGFDAG